MSTLAPPRVGLLQACDDEQLFGVRLWPRQRELLARVEDGPRIGVWALGRRSGKTTMSALVGLWSCLLRPELRRTLRPGERGWAVAVATNHRQAKLLVRAALTIVERSPLLAPLVESTTDDEILFSTGMGFAAFPCSSRGGRGWPIHTFVMDEAAHFLSETEGPQVADRIWQAMAPSTAQFGDEARILVGSTPWGEDGLFARLYTQAETGEIEDARAATATTREMNPTISDSFLAAEERRDPDGFRAEYLAQFTGSGASFFDPDNIRAAVTLPGELRPEDGVMWVAGCDPAFSSDPFALTLVGRHPQGRRLFVGLVRSWQPPRRKAASLDEARRIEDTVLSEVAQVVRLFGARVILDQYKAAGIIERLRLHGVSAQSIAMTAPTKDAAFGFLRGRLNDGSIEMFEHPQLLRELRAVRTRYAAGRSSVVLPRIGGSHCDLAQSLAIACLEHDRHGGIGSNSEPSFSAQPSPLLDLDERPFSYGSIL